MTKKNVLQEKKWFLLEILLFLFIGAFTPLLEVQFPNKMYCSSNLRFEASLFISSSLSVIGNVLPFSSDGKESGWHAGVLVQSLGQEDSLEKEMATHSRLLPWRIPWTEEPDGL